MADVELPSPLQLLVINEKTAVFVQIFAAVGVLFSGGIVVGAVRRYQRRKRQRVRHERRVQQWLAEKEAERAARVAFLKQTGELRDDTVPPLLINVDETYQLWKEAHDLGCNGTKALRELLAVEIDRELAHCVASVGRDWRSERRLGKILGWVREMGVCGQLSAALPAAKAAHQQLLRRNRFQLLAVMLFGSQFRLLGIALTSVVAFLTERIESGVADTYTLWMDCFVHYDSHNTIMKWACINLVLCLVSSLVTYSSEKISALMLSRIKKDTDTKLYKALASMDMEFF
eukprot:RCo014709